MDQPDLRPSTPAGALAELLAGNQRFVSGTRVHPHQDAEYRVGLAAEQRPFAVLFGCSDSRLSAEIIFDRGLGDLFVVRTAGHILGPEVRASIDYAVAVLHTPLVVVLGHDSCGAIAASLASLSTSVGRVGLAGAGDLSAIVDRIMPSIEQARARRVTDPDQITGVHVERTIDLLSQPGTTIGDAVEAGRCAVVGLTYRLAEGRVSLVGARAQSLEASAQLAAR